MHKIVKQIKTGAEPLTFFTTHANINNTFDIYWVRITGFGNLDRSQIRWFTFKIS